MSDDLVRAEVNAVRTLKRGIERYAEQIRDASANARRDVAAADRKAQETVERRRSEALKREHELRQAEAALRTCQEGCSGLQHQASLAAQRLAESRQLLERARKAAQMTAQAQSDLLRVLQTTEATVGEHSSVASSALASLDAKLAGLPKFGVGHAIHTLAAGAVVGVEIYGATMNIGRMAGNALQAGNISNPLADDSLTEMVEREQEQERDYVIGRDLEARKRANSGEGRQEQA